MYDWRRKLKNLFCIICFLLAVGHEAQARWVCQSEEEEDSQFDEQSGEASAIYLRGLAATYDMIAALEDGQSKEAMEYGNFAVLQFSSAYDIYDNAVDLFTDERIENLKDVDLEQIREYVNFSMTWDLASQVEAYTSETQTPREIIQRNCVDKIKEAAEKTRRVVDRVETDRPVKKPVFRLITHLNDTTESGAYMSAWFTVSARDE